MVYPRKPVWEGGGKKKEATMYIFINTWIIVNEKRISSLKNTLPCFTDAFFFLTRETVKRKKKKTSPDSHACCTFLFWTVAMKKHNINSGRLFFLSLFEDGSVYTVEREREDKMQVSKAQQLLFFWRGQKKGGKKRGRRLHLNTQLLIYASCLENSLSIHPGCPETTVTTTAGDTHIFFEGYATHIQTKTTTTHCIEQCSSPLKKKRKTKTFLHFSNSHRVLRTRRRAVYGA